MAALFQGKDPSKRFPRPSFCRGCPETVQIVQDHLGWLSSQEARWGNRTSKPLGSAGQRTKPLSVHLLFVYFPRLHFPKRELKAANKPSMAVFKTRSTPTK